MSTHRSSLARLLALSLCLALLLSVALASNPAKDTRVRGGRRTRLQAGHTSPDSQDKRVPSGNALSQCSEDLAHLCVEPIQANQKEMKIPTASEIWECVTSRVNEIQNEGCREYISSMIVCNADAQKLEGCLSPAATEIISLRRCMRDARPEMLSTACTESEFYRSIQHPAL